MQTILLERLKENVVVMPFLAISYASKLARLSLSEVYKNPKKCISIQLLASEMHGYEPFPLFAYASFGPWEFGGEIEFPEGKGMTLSAKKTPIQNPDDVEKLILPDLQKSGSMPFMIEVANIQKSLQFPITFQIGSIFTMACNIIGFERAMRWLLKEKDLVHSVLRKVKDFSVEIAEYFIKRHDLESCIPLELSIDSNDLISPKQFEEFVLPYTKEIHEKILKMGVPGIFTHVCGEQNRNLEYWQKIPFGKPGMISFGSQVDLNVAKNMFGKENIIVGNLDTTSLMMKSFEEVLELSRKCIEKGKDSQSGYVLAPACEIPPDTPPLNIHAMVKAAKDLH